jgi:MFS family permease
VKLRPPIAPDNVYAPSLSVSWKEGIAAAVMQSLFDYYFIPLALFLKATVGQVSFLVAVPHLTGSVAQLLSDRFVRYAGGRRRCLIVFSALQAFFLFPMALLPFSQSPARLKILICLVILFRVLSNLIATVWGSLVSDYLTASTRGHYFGWRSRIAGAAGMTAILAAGLILTSWNRLNPAVGFFVIFFLAGICRIVSAILMARMQDIRFHGNSSGIHRRSLLSFLSRLKKNNFFNFLCYASAMMFSAMISSSYISVYILRDRHWSYLTYSAIQMAPVIAGLIAYPLWGKHADRVGNAEVLKVTGALIPLIPLYWLLVRNPFILMACELFSGFIWGGFNLCVVNFIFDSFEPEKRVRFFGYFNLLNGTAIFFGAIAGGFLSTRVPALLGSNICSLFLISLILRLLTYGALAGSFREVRKETKKISRRELIFSVLGINSVFKEHQD